VGIIFLVLFYLLCSLLRKEKENNLEGLIGSVAYGEGNERETQEPKLEEGLHKIRGATVLYIFWA
jgi:hypothetical protein